MYPIWTAILVSSFSPCFKGEMAVPTCQRGGRGVYFVQPMLRSARSISSECMDQAHPPTNTVSSFVDGNMSTVLE